MSVFWRMGCVCAAASMLAGCAVGGIAAFSPATPTPPAPAVPPPVTYGSFLEGPVAQKLSATDRDKALSAEQDALVSGQRRPWRGDKGVFGYVEPAAGTPALPTDGSVPPAGAAAEVCRSFTSTIYIAGRPQVGHGRGCQNPDGTYRIIG